MSFVGEGHAEQDTYVAIQGPFRPQVRHRTPARRMSGLDFGRFHRRERPLRENRAAPPRAISFIGRAAKERVAAPA